MEDADAREGSFSSGTQFDRDVENCDAEYREAMSRAHELRQKLRGAKRRRVTKTQKQAKGELRSHGGILEKYGRFKALGYGEALPKPRVLEDEELRVLRNDPESRVHVNEYVDPSQRVLRDPWPMKNLGDGHLQQKSMESVAALAMSWAGTSMPQRPLQAQAIDTKTVDHLKQSDHVEEPSNRKRQVLAPLEINLVGSTVFRRDRDQDV